MKLFVAGGTGFVGNRLVLELIRSGHSVRLLVHRRTAELHENIELYEGDVTSSQDTRQGADGCDAIVNLVGIIREFPSRGITFKQLHVQATANLVAAAELQGISRYIQMSALGTRPNAVSAYHQSKSRGEAAVRSSRLDWTIFRPSLIYGPNDAFVNMLANQIRRSPVIPLIGDGMYRLQPVFVDDVAFCFTRSLELSETIGQTYELCGNERMSYCDLLDTIARTLGKKPPIKIPLPLGFMKKIIPIMQKIPQFPITSDQLQMLLEENICDDCIGSRIFRLTMKPFSENIRGYLA